MTDELAIGIDLGTSYSCVAYVKNGVPEVIPNSKGELTHASYVSFLKSGSVVVGNEAKRGLLTNPEFTVYSSKRLIGRYFFSDEVSKAKQMMSYQLVEGPNNSIQVRVREKTLSLPEISALILKEMKMLAEEHLGRPVTKAIVTVPAYFNDNQRQATKDAGRIAGLEVLRILNEPTAAALAYGCGQGLATQKVVVYDLGGGTFDVSILEIGKDIFEVLSSAGDTYLGGDDFDDRIASMLLKNFSAEHQIDLKSDPVSFQRVKETSEWAKIEIGKTGSAKIEIPGVAKSKTGHPLSVTCLITEPQFNQMVMDLIQRTFKVCDEALQSARLTASDIDQIILVGGPTRLPIVKQSVTHYFQKAPLAGVDPDRVVAMGAALQADALLSANTDTLLVDVTPLPLRIGTVGGYTEKVIEKNTPIPIDRSKTFTTSRDGQERVKIRVYQGDSNRADECAMLGEFEFSGFKKADRGEVKIQVTFEIDSDGIVQVSALDAETGQKAFTTLQLSSGLTEKDILKSISLTESTQMSRN